MPDPANNSAPWLGAFNSMVAQMWADFAGWAGDTPPPQSPEYMNRKRAFVAGASMMRKRATLMVLDDIARRRPLEEPEEVMVGRIAAQLARRKRPHWRWTPAEDAKLMRLIKKRAEQGRPKPYERNGEVAKLARDMGRTYMAVHRRMERLRKRANCSNAAERMAG